MALSASRFVCWAIEVMTLMTLPISALLSPSLATVALVFSATLTAEVATLAASLAFLAISLMLAPISSVPVATVVTFLLTCSAAAEATLAWVAVSSALAAICWLTAVSSWLELASTWAVCAMLETLPRRFVKNLASPSPIWPTASVPLIVNLPREVAAAGRIDHIQDALHLDAQFLGLLPLAFGRLLDLAFDFQLLGDQFPGDHRAEVVLVLVVDGGDQQVGRLGADVDVGPDGQVLGVAEDLPLMGRVLVEDVDARTQDVLRLDRQVTFESCGAWRARRGSRR